MKQHFSTVRLVSHPTPLIAGPISFDDQKEFYLQEVKRVDVVTDCKEGVVGDETEHLEIDDSVMTLDV